jgi:uncharacterized protein YidB (DUF937 family)
MPERSNRQIVDVSRILEQARTAGGDPSKLVASVSKVVSEQGGLGAIVEKLKSSGLGDKVESWVGTSENQPAESDAVADAIGHEHVARIATETGLPEDQAERGLASVLPELINQSTPEGRVPSDGGGGALSSLMASVGQKMG